MWVGVVRGSICGSNWFMGISVVCGSVGIDLVCGYRCGCVVGISVVMSWLCCGLWVSAWVEVVHGSICGSDWFVGISVVCGFMGICVVVCGFQRGCVVVRGYQHGSICLIFVKFCCGLISNLVRLFCFVLFFIFSFFLFFLFFFFCGWWLQVEKWKVVGSFFIFYFLLL